MLHEKRSVAHAGASSVAAQHWIVRVQPVPPVTTLSDSTAGDLTQVGGYFHPQAGIPDLPYCRHCISPRVTVLIARLRKLLSDLGDVFWLLPGAMVVIGIVGAMGMLAIDRSGIVPQALLKQDWLYNGGGTGARTLLGAVVASTIGVAGTVFSITIAALSLAAGQMGPRLLRNFTRDRGNQFTLGVFLGTFSYSLMVLRTVRDQNDTTFVPNLSLTVSILLAFLCVATLVYFVGHMAGRINVSTVIGLVSNDVRSSIGRHTTDRPQPTPPPPSYWRDATVILDSRHGYLQQLDANGLADWAAEHGTVIRLLVRPGDHVLPGAPIALTLTPVAGAEKAIRDATALGSSRASSQDFEYEIRQLVEVAVRALSPGINDPHTAMSVLDRLGLALSEVAPVHLPSGVTLRHDKVALVVPGFDYDGLVDAMFHLIRQNATGSTAVLARMLEVLTGVVSCEHDERRVKELQRHADLIIGDAERHIDNPSDLADLHARYRGFHAMREHGALGYIGALES